MLDYGLITDEPPAKISFSVPADILDDPTEEDVYLKNGNARFTLGQLRALIDSLDSKWDHLPVTMSDRENFITDLSITRDRVMAPIYNMGRDIYYPSKTHYYKLVIQNEQ